MKAESMYYVAGVGNLTLAIDSLYEACRDFKQAGCFRRARAVEQLLLKAIQLRDSLKKGKQYL